MAKKTLKQKLSDKFYSLYLFFKLVKMRCLWIFTYHKDHRVTVYKNINDIPKALHYGDQYIPDPPRDPVYHPTLIQKRIDEGKKIGDCDDHAIYWCVALVKSGLAKKVWFSTYFWDAAEGHAICVFEGLDGELYWGDYFNPYPTKATKILDTADIPAQFAWLRQAMEIYGAHIVSTAEMYEVSRVNDRDVPILKRAHWINGPVVPADFTVIKTK